MVTVTGTTPHMVPSVSKLVEQSALDASTVIDLPMVIDSVAE